MAGEAVRIDGIHATIAKMARHAIHPEFRQVRIVGMGKTYVARYSNQK
jgi:hypothetical protein